MTAEWEENYFLLRKVNITLTFINEMKDFTKEIVGEIKHSEQKYKHDNLTSTECPNCGKFMIKVKLKRTNASVSRS